MKCPVCKEVDLVMADRQGVEIDYCPTCRGVWLDRGELDKIVERSPGMQASSSAERNKFDDGGDEEDGGGGGRSDRRGRKQSWFSNLLDFGD
jgi:Zn-finger nucleic acid-binding protein